MRPYERLRPAVDRLHQASPLQGTVEAEGPLVRTDQGDDAVRTGRDRTARPRIRIREDVGVVASRFVEPADDEAQARVDAMLAAAGLLPLAWRIVGDR